MIKVLVLLLVFNISLYADTLKQIREDIRYELRDIIQFTMKPKFNDQIYNTLINEAQKDMVSRTRCLETVLYMNTTADTMEYSLPSDLLLIEEVKYANVSSSLTVVFSTTGFKSLERYTIMGLNSNFPYWETLKGMPLRYTVVGSTMIFQPIPSVSFSGENRVKIYYYRKVNSLVNDSDIPFNGLDYLVPYHSIIKWYVCARLSDDPNKIAYYET